MTKGQRELSLYIHGSAGNCYQMTDFAKRCVVGMLQTGEITEPDFEAITNGESWLETIKEYAEANGWTW